MQFFFKSLAVRVTFAFIFLVHFSNGQFEIDTNGEDETKVPKVEHEKTPDREMWFETSKGNNITLTCPKLPGSPPAVIEIHEPMRLERKLVISTSGQLRLHNVTYDDAKTYYCTYFTEAPTISTAKIHLNVYDVFGGLHLRRSRRSAEAIAHNIGLHLLTKGHSSHGAAHAHSSHGEPHGHSSHGAHHEHSSRRAHDDSSAKVADQVKAKGKEEDAHARTDKNKTAENAKEEPKHETVAKADEEKDANENYDDDVQTRADVIVPPSSPDVTQLSESSVRLKWTSGAVRDRGVKGYKVEYMKGNLTHIDGGIHGWRTIANKVRPKFRIFKVEHLQPEMSYRFRVATIYAGNKYIYSLSSGWVKLQRYS